MSVLIQPKPNPRRTNSRQPLFLSPAEAAVMADLSTKTIRRLIARGTLPAYRVAGTRAIRIKAADLDALLQPIPSAAGAV